jgi:predicted RNA methylase
MIEQKTVDILDKCNIKENVVFLPNVQMDRKTYLQVNKCLEGIGGKWNKKAKGHVFDSDPIESFNRMLASGKHINLKKELQFFETPAEMATEMIIMADLQNGDTILEPSAGKGAILDSMSRYIKSNGLQGVNITAVEQNHQNNNILLEKGYIAHTLDFLEFTGMKFNKIIMNPPFTKQQDIDHVLHAYSLLSNDGVLVSVVSESPFFRGNKKSLNFRKFILDRSVEERKNKKGAFKASGTMVETRIIKLCK